MKNNFKNLLYLGICIIIAVFIVILVVLFSNKDNFVDKCPDTCGPNYVCPPQCAICHTHGTSPPSPSPPSPGPPSPGGRGIPNTHLINLINSEIKTNNKICSASYSEYQLPESIKIPDNSATPSNNFPINFNIKNINQLKPNSDNNYSTNVYIIDDPQKFSTLLVNLQSELNIYSAKRCNFTYNSGLGQGNGCNFGAYSITPITLLITKSGKYNFQSVSGKYFMSIFGLVDNVEISNINFTKNNWSNNVDNNFFMTIQNCTISSDSDNITFATSQGTSIVRCKVDKKINLGSGSPGYMRNTILNGDTATYFPPKQNGCQQYLFNECTIKNPFQRVKCLAPPPGQPPPSPYCQYIFGLLNCTGDGVQDTGLSCNNTNNKNNLLCKYKDNDINPSGPIVTYKDNNVKNEEFISIDTIGVYSFTKVNETDVTIPIDKSYWKNQKILNQDNINDELLKNNCYILPGGRYYLNKPLIIPEGTILYGLGFVNLVPTFDSDINTSIKSVVIVQGGYLCNCVIDAPKTSLNYDHILYIENYSKVFNTHVRILVWNNNYDSSGLKHDSGDIGSMMFVNGNNNYIEHSWLWISDHNDCNNGCHGGQCNLPYKYIGLYIKGENNKFVGMFVEHQYMPIYIEGNNNKIIWSQGEGGYTGMPTTESYLTIGKKVKQLTYVMAGIYAIFKPFKYAITFENEINVDDINTETSNDISDISKILIRDFYITGWAGSATTPYPLKIGDSLPKNNLLKTNTINCSGDQIVNYICDISECLSSAGESYCGTSP